MHVSRSLWGLVLVAVVASGCGHAVRPRLDTAAGAQAQSDQGTLPDNAALVADGSLVIGSQTYRLGATTSR